jgi:hypothetical protein
MTEEAHGAAQAMLVGPEDRGQETFGGLLPSAAVSRSEETVVLALSVEHHADGAAIPLLCLSSAPGVLGLDPESAIGVTDDQGRAYDVTTITKDAGLGAVQATIWVTPAIPPDARRLEVEVRTLSRVSTGRRGGGERPLTDGPWRLDLDLLPERTAAEQPARPRGRAAVAASAKAPARSAAAFEGLVPIGQARVGHGLAVCVWSLERYGERAVLSLGCLTAEGVDVTPLAPGKGEVRVWDDAGGLYEVAPIHGSAGSHWIEASLEITPAPPPEATALGIRIADLPGTARTPEGRHALEGPFDFGVTLRGA